MYIYLCAVFYIASTLPWAWVDKRQVKYFLIVKERCLNFLRSIFHLLENPKDTPGPPKSP